MSENISLDQVRSDDKFNFVSQYDSYNQFDVDDVESPPRSCNITNEYYEPGQFCDTMKDSHNSMSYFHLNCRGLSTNWESFSELLCDLHGDFFSFDFVGVSEVYKCDLHRRIQGGGSRGSGPPPFFLKL